MFMIEHSSASSWVPLTLTKDKHKCQQVKSPNTHVVAWCKMHCASHPGCTSEANKTSEETKSGIYDAPYRMCHRNGTMYEDI